MTEEIAKQRLAKYPGDFIANFNLGDLLLSQGKAEEAMVYFRKASEADPRSSLAASELGVALFTTKKLDEAAEQFKRALLIDPSYTDARFNLASVEASAGHWEAAVNDFKQVIAERPDNSKARDYLGQVIILWGDEFAKSGKDEDAVAHYREALLYRGDDIELHGRLGMAFARMEKLDESQVEFETILRLDPNSEQAKQAIEAIKARRKK